MVLVDELPGLWTRRDAGLVSTARRSGHSSGAIYALEAARRVPVAGFVLYEPPLHGFHGRFVDDVLARLRTAARGDRFDELVAAFLRYEAEMPEEELSLLKRRPLWEHMVALAPQSLREWEELAEVRLTVDRYRNLAVPDRPDPAA